MNKKMSALLQRAGLRWPVEALTISRPLPALEIFEDCVLLKDQWDPNKHVKIAECFDRTGFECFINHVHLPFDGTNQTLISCLEYVATLQQTLMPLTDRRFRVIVSLSEDDESPKFACTVRFHQIRPGEDWIEEDIEGYKSEAMLVFDVPSLPQPSLEA
ncbi:MAG: hypothetical protein WA718_17530 [Terriglobales bacterium]